MWLKFINNMRIYFVKWIIFWCRSSIQGRSTQQSAVLNYEKYGISVEEPILIEAHMKARYRVTTFYFDR